LTERFTITVRLSVTLTGSELSCRRANLLRRARLDGADLAILSVEHDGKETVIESRNL
jgi:hypothetical protein